MEQPDPKLSYKQLELVSRLSEEELNKIDSVLMSFASTRNRKVARVVMSTMSELRELELGIPDIFYGQRVKLLVEKGLLVADGNLDYMRYSEVRLP